MQHFRKILVGVDLSHDDRLASPDLIAPTQEAVRRAIWLGSQIPAELMFFAALEVSPQTEDALKEKAQRGERTVVDEAQDVLGGLVERARQEGVKAAGSRLVFGRPWMEIIRQVLRAGHDLVIVGTRHHAAAARLVLGGTALKLLRKCPCPVWVTKPDPNWDDLNILVASDFSETADDALQIGVQAGQLSGAKLHLLHSVEHTFDRKVAHADLPPNEREAQHEKEREEAQRRLRLQLAPTDSRTLPHGVMVHVKDGPPDLALLAAIEEHGIDLLVMGTAARHGLSGMLLGNTAERLLPHVPCSVLVVKPRDFESPVAAE